MSLFSISLLLLLSLLYVLLFSFIRSVYVRFVTGYVFFWSANTIIAFFLRFFHIKLTLFLLYGTNLIVAFLLFLLLKKEKHKHGLLIQSRDVVAFLLFIFTFVLLFIGSLGFERVIAVLSFAWDMATHYQITSDIVDAFQVSLPSYPFGFHLSAATFIRTVLEPSGKLLDHILRTSLFSLFIQFSLSLLTGCFCYLVLSVKQIQKNKLRDVSIGLLSGFIFLSIILPVLWQGFISVLFATCILFVFLCFENSEVLDTKVGIIVGGCMLFLLSVSYTYYIPVYALYQIVKLLRTKQKKYLLFLFIQLVPLYDVFVQALPSGSSVLQISSQWGWFVPFPWYLYFLCILGAIVWLRRKIGKKGFGECCEDQMCLIFFLFVGYSLFLLFLNQGKQTYSVYKSSIPLISISVLFGFQWLNDFIYQRMYKVNNLEHNMIIGFISIVTLYLCFYFFPGGGLPGIHALATGRLRFFENKPEIYMLYAKILEKQSDYDQIIMIDVSVNRLRWWSTYLGAKTPVSSRINSMYRQMKDFRYYEDYISKLPENKKLLVVDPYNILIEKCERGIVDIILSGKKHIDVFFPLSKIVYEKRCK